MEAKLEYKIYGEQEEKMPDPSQVSVYLKAKIWSFSLNPKQAALGKEAAERLANGEDPAVVLEEMESSWAAFQVAQEG